MINQSPVFSREPSSILRYDGSDNIESSDSCELRECQGCGAKHSAEGIPFVCVSSSTEENHKCSNESKEQEFNQAINDLEDDILISKYLKKAEIIPIEEDISGDDSPYGVQSSEHEVKLGISGDYEIHTITEESEQVTQTDCKIMTPTTFSSKLKTQNERYSNNQCSSSDLQNCSNKETVAKTRNRETTNIQREKKYETFTQASIKRQILNLKIIPKSAPELKLKPIQTPSQASKQKNYDYPKCSKNKKSKILSSTTNLSTNKTFTKKGRIKKGKLIKTKKRPGSRENRTVKVLNSGSTINFSRSPSNKLLKHTKISANLNQDKSCRKEGSFLQRMEIDMKLRNCRRKSKTKRKVSKRPKRNNQQPLINLKIQTEAPGKNKYEFDQELQSDSCKSKKTMSKLMDCINMISLDLRGNEKKSEDSSSKFQTPVIIPHTPNSLFDYGTTMSMGKTDESRDIHPIPFRKSLSISSIKKKSETERAQRRDTNKEKLQKFTRENFRLTKCKKKEPQVNLEGILDKSLTTVIKKLKKSSMSHEDNPRKLKYNTRSMCSNYDRGRADRVNSFISYTKNKYSATRSSNKDNPCEDKAPFCDLSNLNNTIKETDEDSVKKSQLNEGKPHIKEIEVRISSNVDMGSLEFTLEGDTPRTPTGSYFNKPKTANTSEKENIDVKEHNESSESGVHLCDKSLHSSNITESYQSLSTIQRERSDCFDTNEKGNNFCQMPVFGVKNPFG
ncbi:unnamed protein product [Moneuplotes crassus]|uniref:Uncharacterized protein n=1 Tax=Euplotes crassus TaxID=5936 RepID=A0AAD1U4E2_EUPCR|nr:unnamed protein product [Moneuplotes crassus]